MMLNLKIYQLVNPNPVSAPPATVFPINHFYSEANEHDIGKSRGKLA